MKFAIAMRPIKVKTMAICKVISDYKNEIIEGLLLFVVQISLSLLVYYIY